jgi:hypothetical protein
MKRLLLGLAVAFAALGIATGGAAAVSPTVRLTIVHAVQGCHMWGDVDGQALGRTRAISLKRGGRISIRINCPMSFDFVQLAGPRLALGAPRTFSGTARTIVFARPGVYRFKATNVETSAQQRLATLGTDNTLLLTVRVS